ncbi:MATE family efflux transporter [Sporosarcina trichiuri]|uniref:MATE family efflux transporter n=1 Tax=Sporosarcina trichiuri TaxID=3056445 RepID=UPI0025B39A0C|nr:MATE family efflux transporter [Sporosarcina sp. 0.2-SM1T-5]WJY27572.1 MATE family efflux transporter [Sporosarcina sp. 0.2-SM1T-5]
MKTSSAQLNDLDTAPVGRIFLRYLIPSMIGMLLMAVNIVADGIMVGNRLGAAALAGVGIAAPVYSIFVAVSLWIGIGAATKYSSAMGGKDPEEGRRIFSHALVSIILITIIIGVIAYAARTPLAYLLGANAKTLPFVSDYLYVILIFGVILTAENMLSIFIRNDGGPTLAMSALIATSVLNIVLNYLFLFVYDFGVQGAAFATILASALGILIMSLHFFKKTNNLKWNRFTFDRRLFAAIVLIGFPSFLSEVGISVFTISHNIAFERTAGTDGVAAFAILNYVHNVLLMLFLGLGSAVQPLISYYRGAKNSRRIRKTMQLAMGTALGLGIAALLAGQFAAGTLVSLFGDFSPAVRSLAVSGIHLFFLAYLFTGMNFVMMTYYQSTGNVRMATWITASREILIMLLFLAILPPLFGVTGIWLAIPASEFVVFLGVWLVQRKAARPIIT